MPQIPRKQTPPPAGCLWIDEAADHVGLSKLTLYKYRQKTRAGTPTGPPSFAIGRKVCYEIAALDAYLAAQMAAGAEMPYEQRPPEFAAA